MSTWKISVFLLCVLAAAAFAQQPASGITIIQGATVFTGAAGRTPIRNAAIVIEGGRIREIGPRAEVRIPSGAQTVDARNKWIIPGLIDAHVHFGQSGGLYTRPDMIDLRKWRPYEKELEWIKERLPFTFERYLLSGITGVVDVGGAGLPIGLRLQAVRPEVRDEVPRLDDRGAVEIDVDLLVFLAHELFVDVGGGRALGPHHHQLAGECQRADELLQTFDLTEAARRPARTYSGGMRRRLDIAASLVGHPDVIFLDEPTTGLDPVSRLNLWQIVEGLVADGTTVLLTTQYLDEADRLADRIAVVDHGRVIAEGSSSQLKASVGTGALHVRLVDPLQRPAAEQALLRVLDTPVRLDSDAAVLSARTSDAERVARALSELSHAGVAVANFSMGQPSLDEVFLALTGRPAAPQNGEATIVDVTLQEVRT